MKPTVPTHVPYVYGASFIISQIWSYTEHPFLHGVFSVSPLFMLLYVLKNRLIRHDLASCMIMVSFLAEAFGIASFTEVQRISSISSRMRSPSLQSSSLSTSAAASSMPWATCSM